MALTIDLTNFDEKNIVQSTNLTASITAGVSSLAVDNTSDFANNGFILLGSIGAKNAELVQAGTITSANTIPLVSPTKLAHGQYENVSALFGNQLRVYRAPNVDGSQPADSVFLANLLGAVTIDANNTTTSFTDSTGGTTYWYKYTHYNSVTLAETDISASNASRLGVSYCSNDDIRAEAGFSQAPYITNDMIEKKRLAAQNEIDSTLSDAFSVPFAYPIPAMISEICVQLAAGLLLLEKYSSSINPDTNGTNKVAAARAELMKLQQGNTPIVDANGKNIGLPNPNTAGSGWPNSTTADSDPSIGGAPRYFRMSSVSGYRSRDF